MEKKNIILEVDESTSLMVEKIKSSILSDFIENIEGVRKSLSALLEGHAEIIESLSHNTPTVKDLKKISDNIDENIEVLQDGIDELSEKLGNITDFPDPKPLMVSLEMSARRIEQFQDIIDRILDGVAATNKLQSDNFAEMSKNIRTNHSQLSGLLDAINKSQQANDAGLCASIKTQGRAISEFAVHIEEILGQSEAALKNRISDLSESQNSKITELHNEWSERVNGFIAKTEARDNVLKESLSASLTSLMESVSELFHGVKALQTEARDKIIAELNTAHDRITTYIGSGLDNIRHNQNDILAIIRTVSEKLGQGIESINESIAEEAKIRKQYESSAKEELDNLNQRIDLLISKIDNLQSLSDSNHASITERLKQILYTVTPFWKKKNLND